MDLSTVDLSTMATVDLSTVAQPQEAAPECTVVAPMEQWQKEGFASMRAWISAYNKKRYAATKAAKKEVAAVAAAAAAAAAAATAASESALAALAAVASPMLPIQSLPAYVPELYEYPTDIQLRFGIDVTDPYPLGKRYRCWECLTCNGETRCKRYSKRDLRGRCESAQEDRLAFEVSCAV